MSKLRIALALFALLALAPGATYSVLWGTAGFAEPGTWSEITRVDADSISVVGFVLPRPRGDSTAPAANVVVDIAINHGHQTLAQFAELKMKQLSSGPGSPKVVADSISSGDNSRLVTWASNLRGTVYDIGDRFAVRDSIRVNIRTILPRIYRGDAAWQAQFKGTLDTLMRTMCVGSDHLFPSHNMACADISRVLPFTEKENADGALFVWFMNRRAKLPYTYVPTSGIPTSPAFRAVPADSAQVGDIAWWPTLVAVYSGPTHMLALPSGAAPLASAVAQLGEPNFFRRRIKQ